MREDEGLRAALEEDVAVPPYTNGTTALAYLLRHDLSQIGTRMNAIDLLSRLLTAMGVRHRPDVSASEIYGLCSTRSRAGSTCPRATSSHC